VVALFATALAACGGGEKAGSGVVVRDSAGITIVESRTPLWRSGTGWKVAREALVSIGTSDGGPETQLYRTVGATRLPDGRIVIANAGTSAIRFYDAQGGYIREVGGQGEGPGEFVRLDWLHRFGEDSLIVFDSRLHRLSVFDSDGSFTRAFRLERVIAFPEFPLAGGGLGASTRDLVPRSHLQTGVNRDSTTVLTFSMEGIPRDTIGPFPTPETYLWVEGSSITVVPYPFARTLVLASFGDGFYFGSSDAYEIRVYATDGTVERIIRRTDAMRSATQADIERFKAEALANARSEDHRRQLERIFKAMSFPKMLPAFVDVVVDVEGYLWVEAYHRTSEDLSRWDVFDREGRWLGTVEMTPELGVYEIGTDYVLGKSHDALGTEAVQLYRLVRGGIGARVASAGCPDGQRDWRTRTALPHRTTTDSHCGRATRGLALRDMALATGAFGPER
jgi:hypothetical protein